MKDEKKKRNIFSKKCEGETLNKRFAFLFYYKGYNDEEGYIK